MSHHKKSCHDLVFINTGAILFTGRCRKISQSECRECFESDGLRLNTGVFAGALCLPLPSASIIALTCRSYNVWKIKAVI